jgi:hypothetical protein
LLLGLALILPGCGGEQKAAAGENAEAPRPAPATVGESGAHPPREAAQCHHRLAGLLDSAESLNNVLAVGLGYEDYLSAVNHVRSTYAPLEAGRLPLVCLTRVASPAEQALNTYIDAANTWGNCLASTSCDPESIEPKLQHGWARASALLTRAQRSLRELR